MTKPLRVLLIDDDPDDRELVLKELGGFSAVEAEQVTDAAGFGEALGAFDFDLVITEYRLRWSDGIAVLKSVKARFPRCPVIMFTAGGSEEVAVTAMKEGLDDYVIKEAGDFARIRTAARSAVERAGAQRRASALGTRLDSLLERSNVGIFRCDSAGNLLEANQPFFQVLGISREAGLTGGKPAEVILSETQLEELRGKRSDAEGPLEWESRRRTDEGREVWLRFRVNFARTAEGRDVIDGVVEDISERKHRERERRRHEQATARLSLLSPREREVAELVAQGKTNKVISRELHISAKTVEMHRAKVKKKLEITNVAELIRIIFAAESLGRRQ